MYKQAAFNSIIRLVDNAVIPSDPGNIDYQKYLEWIAKGNKIEPKLEQLKEEKLVEINKLFIETSYQPVKYKSLAGVEQLYQADEYSKNNLKNVIIGLMQYKTVPAGFFWVALDNTQVDFTYTDLLNLGETMLISGWEAFKKLQARKSEIDKATTIEQLKGVKIV